VLRKRFANERDDVEVNFVVYTRHLLLLW